MLIYHFSWVFRSTDTFWVKRWWNDGSFSFSRKERILGFLTTLEQNEKLRFGEWPNSKNGHSLWNWPFAYLGHLLVRTVHTVWIRSTWCNVTRHCVLQLLSDNLNAIKPFNKIMILSLWANHKLGPLFKNRKVKTSKVLFFWGVSYQTIVMIRQEGFMLTICMLFAK